MLTLPLAEFGLQVGGHFLLINNRGHQPLTLVSASLLEDEDDEDDEENKADDEENKADDEDEELKGGILAF